MKPTAVEAIADRTQVLAAIHELREDVEAERDAYQQRTTSDVACAAVAESTSDHELVKTAHQHWFGIGWPEDAKPVALLERAMELLEQHA